MVAGSLIIHSRILWRSSLRVGIPVPAFRGNRVRTLPQVAQARSTPHRTIRRPLISRRMAVVRTLRLPVRRLARGRVLSDCPLAQLLYTTRHSLPSFMAVVYLHALISPIFVITWSTPRRTLAPWHHGMRQCGDGEPCDDGSSSHGAGIGIRTYARDSPGSRGDLYCHCGPCRLFALATAAASTDPPLYEERPSALCVAPNERRRDASTAHSPSPRAGLAESLRYIPAARFARTA